MYGICLRYAKSEDDAHDMLQEGFIKIFRCLHQYQPIKPLIAWMRKVMVNAALEHLRKNAKRYEQQCDLEYAEKVTSSNYDIDSSINEQALIGFIQSLAPDYREVFNLYAIEGYSHKEIGVMLDITESTSKVRLFRARISLQKMLEEKIES